MHRMAILCKVFFELYLSYTIFLLDSKVKDGIIRVESMTRPVVRAGRRPRRAWTGGARPGRIGAEGRNLMRNYELFMEWRASGDACYCGHDNDQFESLVFRSERTGRYFKGLPTERWGDPQYYISTKGPNGPWKEVRRLGSLKEIRELFRPRVWSSNPF